MSAYEAREQELKDALRREGVDPNSIDWRALDLRAVDFAGIDLRNRDDIERALQEAGR